MPLTATTGYLRSPAYDLTLIFGALFLALFFGWICVLNPMLFPTLLFIDLWFLGTHHVVATFTRLAFDKQSFREHTFLVVWLPIIVVLCVIAGVLVTGPWILATTYLYWQWFHYTRQSYGIARIYKKKDDPDSKETDQWTIYLLPILGILYRSYENPGTFLGMELRVLPVPLIVIQILSVLTIIATVRWLIRQIIAYRQGKTQKGYNLFMFSHFIVFLTGYLVIKDINIGWLVLNVWHNAQYILFVWFYNSNRYKGGIEEEHKFISWLSQKNHIVHYFLTCQFIALFFYFTTSRVLGLITFTTLPLVLIFYQTINFHHYIVDGIIWKIRKKPIQKELGIIK